MPQQLIHTWPTDLARAAPQRSGMIHDPLASALLEAAAPKVHHGMKGQVLLELPVEQQIAGLSATDIARHQVYVELLQRVRVSELGEGASVAMPRKPLNGSGNSHPAP